MKKIKLVAIAMLFIAAAQAQISASLSGNYTMFKGDFRKNTPGIKAEGSYAYNERVQVSLGFIYHFPINEGFSAEATNGGSSMEVPTNVKYNFKTIQLGGRYFIRDLSEPGFNAFGSAGMGLILVNFDEKIKGALPQGYTLVGELAPKEKLNGFSINLGLGAQYTINNFTPFFDAGINLPSNKVNEVYYENPIPAHFQFNVGVRINFGSIDE